MPPLDEKVLAAKSIPFGFIQDIKSMAFLTSPGDCIPVWKGISERGNVYELYIIYYLTFVLNEAQPD
jgi:hypothetical protein